VRREVYEKSEKIFDTSFSLAADYEFILRQLKINKIKVKYLPEILVAMREGGASANGLKQRIKGWRELRRAWKVNNLKIPRFFILKRVLSKIGQYLTTYNR
jgi:glycosyltransferase